MYWSERIQPAGLYGIEERKSLAKMGKDAQRRNREMGKNGQYGMARETSMAHASTSLG